jgi:hypothetical protein
MKRSVSAVRDAQLRARDAEVAELVRQAEAEVAEMRARPDYHEHRRLSVREVRRLAQWLRAVEIAEGDANDEPLRKLVAQAGRLGETWPVEVRERVAAVFEGPPRRKRGMGRLKVNAADRAALRAQMDTERRAYEENRRLAEPIANSAQCETEEVLRTLDRVLADRQATLAHRYVISVDRLKKLTARKRRKPSKPV